jgi:DNA invertase Pin-like site-specific DNA recombinase
MVKLDKNEVKAIRELLEQNSHTHKEIADMFGVSRGHITKIKNKRRWNTNYGKESKG